MPDKLQARDAKDASSDGLFSHPMLERLMHYYLCIHDHRTLPHPEWVTSTLIARRFRMDETQVRRDLATIGLKGRPKAGYRRSELRDRVREVLGLNRRHRAVVVGAGRLGGAIGEYPGFREYGLDIRAFFDTDPGKIGAAIGGRPVLSLAEMGSYVSRRRVRFGILTCPPAAAQAATDILVLNGVLAIWNFASTSIVVPRNVMLRNEHIAVGLAEIFHFMDRAAHCRSRHRPAMRAGGTSRPA